MFGGGDRPGTRSWSPVAGAPAWPRWNLPRRPELLSARRGFADRIGARRGRRQPETYVRPLAGDNELSRRRQRPEPVLLVPVGPASARAARTEQRAVRRITAAGKGIAPRRRGRRSARPGNVKPRKPSQAVCRRLPSVGELDAEPPRSLSRFDAGSRRLPPLQDDLQRRSRRVHLDRSNPHRQPPGVHQHQLQRDHPRRVVLRRPGPLGHLVTPTLGPFGLRWWVEEAHRSLGTETGRASCAVVGAIAPTTRHVRALAAAGPIPREQPNRSKARAGSEHV